MDEREKKRAKSIIAKGPEKFWDEEQMSYFQTMSRMITLSERPYWEARKPLSELKKAQKEKGLLSNLLVPALFRAFVVQARSDALLGTAEIGIANRIYKIKHGKYVDNIHQLSPEILSSLPLDPFTGKNYIYKKKDKGFIVYSVGEDLKDDDGVEKKGLKPDIVWKDNPL